MVLCFRGDNMNKNTDKLHTLFKLLSGTALTFIVIWGIAFLTALVLSISDTIPTNLLIISWITSLITFIVAVVCYKLSRKFYRKYLVAKGDFNSVEEVKSKEASADAEKTERALKEKEQRIREIELAQHPQCPSCKGYNTQRISTAKRVVSTSIIGIASSTIGKQYECKDCLHKW